MQLTAPAPSLQAANSGLRGPTEDEKALLCEAFGRVQKDLFGAPSGESLAALILKESPIYGDANKSTTLMDAGSNQGVLLGRREQPFDMRQVSTLQVTNEYHATCLHTEVACTVGLGFMTPELRAHLDAKKAGPQMDALGNPKPMPQMPTGYVQTNIDKLLSPMCHHSWRHTMNSVCEDFWQVANGYLEVVRADPGTDGNGPITGLHRIPPWHVFYNIEDANYNYHFEIESDESGGTQHFGEFGDLADFWKRQTAYKKTGASSEVVHFSRPTSLSRWYGFPHWLSAVPAIELLTCLKQFKYDFFNNRGVPEFMLFITGAKLSTADWAKVTEALKSNIGQGNSHKSMALNLSDKEIQIQVEKLVAEGSNNDSLEKTNESYQVSVVTAHGVPPLLAGILIPGKLGSSNELPNALQAFQALRVGPAQELIQEKLIATLANDAFNGGLALKPEDCLLRKITEEIDISAMNTVSGMRQSLPQAKAQGRDLKAGMKK